jgi:hypothetical protein
MVYSSVATQILLCQRMLVLSPVAEFIDSDWADKVNSGIRFVPARQATWAGGPVRQPYAGELTLSPNHRSMSSATGLMRRWH